MINITERPVRTYLPSATGYIAVYVGGVGWVRVKQVEYLRDLDPHCEWVPEA